jgi:hypothetical protein
MSTPVNYYHYSVNKLLVVNLMTRFELSASPKKKIRLRPGWRLANLNGFDRTSQTTALPAGFCSPPCCAQTGQDRDLDACPASSKPPRKPENGASVDKPMNIHRIECAKPRHLNTADFLSS